MLAQTLLLAALPLLAQEGHGVTPADIERGGLLFLTNCAICHGPDGDGVSGVDLASNHFRRASSDRELTAIIRNGIPGTPMPPGNFTPGQTEMLVAYLHSMATAPRSAVTNTNPGDAARGKAIVESKGACLTCHRINGVGNFSAPDLSEIGSTRRTADLERSVIDPDAEIRADNRTVQAIGRDGKKIAGRLLNQDTYSLQILNAEARLVSLQKSNLREYEILKTSPMPSYKGKLTPQELSDVLTYLVSLKGRR